LVPACHYFGRQEPIISGRGKMTSLVAEYTTRNKTTITPPGSNSSCGETLYILEQASAVLQKLPHYDVIGMNDLVERLRHELQMIHGRNDGLNSINKLSAKINVSRAYLARFRDGDMVCMNIMNRIANAFGIRYMIENYDDPKNFVIE
jgi:hypothetical protein